ncbi:ADP-ribosylglycohydrolase family protein [Microvirga sp. BT688]|uniref:ADP-ribosylglycohydrolase family protein n=1 Tax=Microvirga sp. TaxID=1873136 RepID=UPI0016865FEC|nr:ADP-ribosylglycohydrolase family protein [Microvirga sp.]MBD2749211.1 ADP-ribosylglycohydrolase family protein [Microvirga sp.]
MPFASSCNSAVRRGQPVTNHVAVDEASVQNRALGAFLGLAVGDALGTTLEFSPKPDRPVLHDIIGGGPFRLEPGAWTDDCSMALALADSLITNPDLDAIDLMKRFVSWYRDGRYSHTGVCFDIGNTTLDAIQTFEANGKAFAGSTDPRTAGNGSIMRLAPVAVRHWNDRPRLIRIAGDQSRTTHAAVEAVACCETLAEILADAIGGWSLPKLLTRPSVQQVRGFEIGQHRHHVRGTGYVVASLHAALWAVSRTSSFADAVLLAANLGEDADTTAAVAGQIAGAIYGVSGIPTEWLDHLVWKDEIRHKAETLFRASLAVA